MMIEHNVSLQPYNTFGIDVRAKHLVRLQNENQLSEILSDKDFKRKDCFILGGGSNVLFTKNVDGLVLKNELMGIEVVKDNNQSVILKVGAGVSWHALVMHSVELGLYGIENLALIPGNVGAAPMQNIGAYGVELKDVFYDLEAVHLKAIEMNRFNAADCNFGYRESVFKREHRGDYIITYVSLKLHKQGKLNTSYGAIAQQLEAMGVQEPTLKDVSDAVIAIRRSKLPDPKVLGNAGSFFKNPVVDFSVYERLKHQYPTMPAYANEGTSMKLAAGWLIEQCGWKGKVVGNTGSHRDQALVLVNYGNATGVEILKLSKAIMKSVFDTFGVQLEQEVNVY
jgi:UDP-N-acetylmuramate dehydrogenase